MRSTATKIIFLLIVCFSLLITMSSKSQTLSQYSFTATSGTFTPISGGTTQSLAGGSTDDGYYPVTAFGFNFLYLGVNYTHFSASTNGMFAIGNSSMSTASSTTQPYLATTTPRPLFVPLGDDQEMGSGSFSYVVTGSAGSRVFTAQWLNVRWYYTMGSPSISYQVILYEGSGRIQFVYRQESGALSGSNESANIGISDAGSNYISLQGNGTSPTTSMTSEYFGVNTKPASGQTYTFSPPSTTGFDISMQSLNSPIVFKPGNNTVNVTVRNEMRDTMKWAYFGYKVDNNTPYLSSKVTFSPKLSNYNTYSYTYPVPVNLPTAGTYKLKVWVTRPNDSFPDNVRTNDTITRTICTGMSGTYTIGSTGDFADFNTAVAAIAQCGITGPIVFNVQPGTYNQRVVIPQIVGASATNTITFHGASKTSVILTYTSTSVTSTLVLSGADYIKFDNMTIQNLGTSYGRGVFLTGQADSNIISNCRIIVNSTVANSYFICIEAGSSEGSYNTTGNNANKTIIENNEITGGYFGIILFGAGSSACCVDNIVRNNVFTGQYYYGFYTEYERGLIIKGNNIDIGSRNNSAYAFYGYFNMKSYFDANKIRPGQYGLYLYYENYYSTGDSSVITNNIISNFYNPTYQAGIISMYYGYNLKMYHNTIWVNGTQTNNYSYAAIVLQYSYGDNRILNNILISTGGTLLMTIYNYSGTGVLTNANDYYYPNATTYMFNAYGSYYYTDLNAWKGATQGLATPHDTKSFDQINPNFTSTTDLHLNPFYPPLKTDPTFVMTDVDGAPRCRFDVCVGADESSYIGAKPGAGFFIDDTVCYGTPQLFINYASANEKKSHYWYLNRVFQTKNLNFGYTFNTVGKDTIMLISENCYGRDTFKKVITVDSPSVKPVADFITMTNSAQILEYVTLYDLSAGCPSQWSWTIKPAEVYDANLNMMMPTFEYEIGSDSTSQNPKLWFNYPGKYSVCLTTSNVRGTSSTMCKKDYIEINAVGIMCIYPPEALTLKGYLNDDLEGPGYSNSSTGQLCSYNIRTCADTLTLNLDFFDVKSGDYFRVYEGTDNTGRPLWNRTSLPSGLGNGMTSASSGYQGTFESYIGTMYIEWYRHAAYNTSLNNPGGFVARWEGHKISIPKPVAKFTCPDTVCMGTNVDFINQSTGTNLSYYWIFDSAGTPANSRDASWVYLFDGVYTVVMTVSNCGGDSTVIKRIVVINPTKAPKPNFYTDLRYPLKGVDVVTLSDSTKGCVDTWKWVITPSTYSAISGFPSSQFPRIRFSDTGCYDVKLITGYNGKRDSILKPCYIHAIDYCTPLVAHLNQDIGIGLVQLGLINNASPVGQNAYTDYTGTQNTTLDKLATYQLTIGRNTAFNSMNRKVWIDYNIDGDFNDAGEEIAFEPSANTVTYTKTFTIPLTAKTGGTRMRIGTSLTSMPNTPCGVNQYGEFEDYRIFIRPDATAPVLTLKGLDTVVINQCDVYKDAGATAMDNVNGNISANIIITNNLNVAKAGTYWFKYNVVDSNGNRATEIGRTVIVIADNIPPVLTVNGKLFDTISVYSGWLEPGFFATDACSGLVGPPTSSGTVIDSITGTYLIKYTATDKLGNSIVKTRTVVVVDKILPTNALKGFSSMTIPVYSKWVDPGVTVKDNYDKKLTVIITGSVDTAHVGTYIINYSVTDASGNGPVVISRTVDVVDTVAPVVTAPGYTDTIKIEVFSTLKEPVLHITDNYYATFSTTRGGSYATSFPTLKASALGVYTLFYYIKDGSANTSQISFIVKVVDTQKPVVTMGGPNVINLCRYQEVKVSDDIATAKDNYDINPVIKKSGTYMTDYLINKKTGFYTLIYTATDGSNNVSDPVTRNINVEDCEYNGIVDGTTAKMEVYPNPNHGEFDVKTSIPTTGKVKITVTNLLGEVIAQTELSAGNGVYHINLSNVSDGVYLVKAEASEVILIQKINITK